MKLSIVSTLYSSEQYIEAFCRRSAEAAAHLFGDDFEIILVNDGSPDNSLEVAIAQTKIDPKVKVIDLSRNFGHHKAMMAGLNFAKGDLVFLIDSDLEEEPEWLEKFYKQLVSNNLDVVFGTQVQRKGGLSEKMTGRVFYKAFRMLTGINQPDNIVTARLMRRDYVKSLLLYTEREINIGGLWIITGFKQENVDVIKHSTSPTTYSFGKKISHLVNAVTSFSSKPLVFTFYFGLIISISAITFIINLLIQFLSQTPPSGYTSVIASIWLFSGLIIFFLGVQGIYLSKIFSETKQRPNFIVKHIYSQEVEHT